MSSHMTLALSGQNLSKNYSGVPAVKSVSFEIKPGECFGLLGPNGAGKSTLMKMVYGHVIPSSGELYVLGLNTKTNMAQIRSRIGVIPQEDGLDTDFSALENMQLFGSYLGLDYDEALIQSEHLLSEMKLSDFKHKHVETLSGGMKRRLVIARALLHKPQMLVLDEPTTGLDPQARLWIWNYFERLKSQNTTMLLTTHYMEEAERLCDRIAIVDHGTVLDMGSAPELIQKHIGNEVIELDVGNEKNYWIGKIQSAGLGFQDYEKKVFIYFKDAIERQKFVGLIQNTHYVLRAANLNDVFLRLAGYQIRSES